MEFFREWFSGYCESFHFLSEDERQNLMLKEKHTYHVCKNSIRIANAESLGQDRALIAEAIGLFHDVGRFPQYAEYKTFRDSISVNHGELGAKVLEENSVLHALPENERGLIITAVKFHNTYKVPDLKEPEMLFFLKLIRDADKLDIWRVFFEYYEKPVENRPSAVGIGLPDSPEYSKEIVSLVMKKQLVPLTLLKTLNDFKLTKLSWLFDLNFDISFRIVAEDNYIGRIAATLPQTGEIKDMIAFLQEYMRQRMQEMAA